jgi:acetyltransferase-like isoleucine patch superfamily enzyme
MRLLAQWGMRLLVWSVYRAYSVEGLNALWLLLPAKFIAPLLRHHGARIGDNIEIHSPLVIHNASPATGRHYANLMIGHGCYFGREVFFDLKDQIVIEDQVTVSMRVMLLTHTDVGRSPVATRVPPSHAPIVIRRGAYLGAGAIILPGVEIGAEAVVGAGAVVTHSVLPATMVAGVPARVLRPD